MFMFSKKKNHITTQPKYYNDCVITSLACSKHYWYTPIYLFQCASFRHLDTEQTQNIRWSDSQLLNHILDCFIIISNHPFLMCYLVSEEIWRLPTYKGCVNFCTQLYQLSQSRSCKQLKVSLIIKLWHSAVSQFLFFSIRLKLVALSLLEKPFSSDYLNHLFNLIVRSYCFRSFGEQKH